MWEELFMSKEQIAITLVGAIISGVLATIITLIINAKTEKKRRKQQLVDDIFGYKYQMTDSTSNVFDINCQGLTRALNRVTIVFHDDSDVLQALDNLWAAIKGNNTKITDDVLITLLKTMCKSAGIKCNDWNDSRFTRVFKV